MTSRHVGRTDAEHAQHRSTASRRPARGRRSLADRDPVDSPSYLVLDVARRVQRLVNAALEPLGVTGPQFTLLGAVLVLGDRGEPPTQRGVAALLGWDEVTTGRVVRLLEAKQLLERPVATDRRARALIATRAGREVAERGVAAVDELDRRTFSPPVARALTEVLLPLSSFADRRPADDD